MLKYIIGVILSIPILPIVYLQSKQVRKRIPKLPEAKGIKGTVTRNSNTLKILTIGESTIAGIGVKTHQKGFTGVLATALAEKTNATIDWKVYAKSGFTAKEIHQEIIPTIIEQDIDLIVLGLGANDAFGLNTPFQWRKDTTVLIETIRLKFPTTPIVFTNMPPIKNFPAFTKSMKWTLGNLMEILGEVLGKVVLQHKNVYYYARIITPKDWIERFNIQAVPSDFFSDGVHPSQLTYQIWAKDTVDFIWNQKTLKEQLLKKNRKS